MNRSKPQQTGFTLIELVIAITIIGIAVTGVMGALSAVSINSANNIILEQAVAIAEAYLQEIKQKPFLDPDGVSGETARSLFDDSLDYNGLVDSGPRDQRGVAITGLQQYTVRVSTTAGVLGAIASANVRRIDVTVTHVSGATVTLSTYQTWHL
ncbi:MAG: prepilin-type N-terminal cleavage/methylation domain-containing protein [Steroidobacteraceae bacterium]